MKILCANVGSTSFKYEILDLDHSISIVKGNIERIGNHPSYFTHLGSSGAPVTGEIDVPDHSEAIQYAIAQIGDLSGLSGVGFKTVFGKGIWRSALIDDTVIQALIDYIPLAPLHNPAYVASIRAFQDLLPKMPLVAVFETWFHQTIPDYAYDFGVPRPWVEKYAVRRYGFHGASHRWISERVPRLITRSSEGLRIISCHLGGSSSLCAIKSGQSIDTSMGISTQYGVIQSTRTGDLDPFAVLYVMDQEQWDIKEITRQLMEESGLKGVSGTSGDLRDVEAAANAGNDNARLAMETFFYGVKKQIGAYIAVLGGLDVIAFTGGIGEKSVTARAQICLDLDWLGIELSAEKNQHHMGEGEISADSSRVKVLVIPAVKEIIVARETANVVKKRITNAS